MFNELIEAIELEIGYTIANRIYRGFYGRDMNRLTYWQA